MSRVGATRCGDLYDAVWDVVDTRHSTTFHRSSLNCRLRKKRPPDFKTKLGNKTQCRSEAPLTQTDSNRTLDEVEVRCRAIVVFNDVNEQLREVLWSTDEGRV